MAKKIDLRSPKVREQKRQVATYGTQTPLSSTAVERGSTRWLDGSNVSIEGLLSVSGTLNASGAINLSGSTGITGPLNVTGTTTIGGNTNITGELNVTGPTTLDGDTDIGGLLDITGKTTIRNDLELLAGGLFKAGQTKIEPTGKATFGNVIIDPASIYLIKTPGGWVSGTGADDITLASSASSSVSLNSARAELDYKGVKVTARAGAIDLNADKVWISGQLEVGQRADFKNNVYCAANLSMTNPPTSTSAANMFIGGSGAVYKVTSASRFKIDPINAILDPRLLQIPIMAWIDKYEFERSGDTTRVPGVIAERVAEAGGEAFVSYTPEGEIEGVAYDRLALARTQILAQQLQEIRDRLEKQHG